MFQYIWLSKQFSARRGDIDLIHKLQEELNILILFVTHEINSITNICKDIIIIKDGEVIEEGKTSEVLSNPKTSYTKELIDSTFENKEFRK